MSESQVLRRELGVPSAVLLGLGSILGTGVFVSIGLVAPLAGSWILASVAAAALLAAANALSSAQLAAALPRSGGTYEYGYALLHPLAGFTAGWMFLCAKSASAATAALGFSRYALELAGVESTSAAPFVACGAVVVLTALAAGGLRRSNAANTVIVSVTITALVAFIAAGARTAIASWGEKVAPSGDPEWPSFLESIALMFVAYTGYGRIATLGEEVRDPQRTIPRAIVATLGVSAALYAGVALVGAGSAGPEGLRASIDGASAPLATVAKGFGVAWIPEIVAAGAATAMLGVLLNLLLGLSRVLLAMGRRGDMPRAVAAIDAARSTPRAAVIAVGTLVLALAAAGSIRFAWSFSAFTVLVYYALTNLAALRLDAEQRLYPRWIAFAGLGGCLFIAFWVEWQIWASGCALVAAGAIWHTGARRLAARRTSAPR